jgi:uncharacterized protein (TIGR03435 family)
MSPSTAATVLAVLSTGAAFGQAPAPPVRAGEAAESPRFEIADVHVSPRAEWVKTAANRMQGGILNGGRYELRRATMLDLITVAYAVDAVKISGGPSWLDYDRFSIAAKAPPGTRPETLRLMLQSLLADRFKLAVKQDTRPAPAWVLSAAGAQPKLKPAENSSASGCRNLPPVFRDDMPYNNVQCRNVTLDVFAAVLRQRAAAAFNSLPVVNSTGLEGAWDIDLEYPAIRVNGPGIADAVQKQLGLKLELGTAPQPVLAVESVNEQPSPNPPGIAEALPPLPAPEFEVASIRPCDRNSQMSTAPRFESGGRVTANCWGLAVAIRNAWGLGPFDEMPGAPKWLDSAGYEHLFTLAAKAPAGAFVDAQGRPDQDAMNAMIRALLIDRFKMAAHYEERPMSAFTLVAAKPKLTKADPANRTGCTRQNAPAGGVVVLNLAEPPPPLRLVCQNITMAQFAEQILGFYPDAHYPVLDETGLEGAWDFTLSYSIILNLPPALAGRGGGAAGEPPDPSGAISFAQALEKQLGLKLETHKRPVRVLVIDHIEERPTEN